MRRTVVAALALLPMLALAPTLVAQQAAPQRGAEPATSLTLYQDGRVLVRRTFPIKVPSGLSTQRVALGAIDPSTLFSLDPEVAYNGATTAPALNAEGALRRAVGKAILFRSGSGLKDTITATVVGVDPIRVRLADGSIYFGLPGTPTYPADLVPAEPTTELRLSARRGTDQLRLGGFAQGGGWGTSYTVILRGSQRRGDGARELRGAIHRG